MASYNHPYHWWGDPWTTPNPMSLTELVETGVLTDSECDWLVDYIRQGGSLIVSAAGSNAGKSTLALALLDALSPSRERIYIRGTYEPFDWLPTADPTSTTLLVNEISPNLPIYCWGETATKVIALSGQGFQVIASMHATDTIDIAQQLTSQPINAKASDLASFCMILLSAGDLSNRVVDPRVGFGDVAPIPRGRLA